MVFLIDANKIQSIELDNDGLVFIAKYGNKYYVIDAVEKEIRFVFDSLEDLLSKYFIHDDTIIVIITDEAIYEVTEDKVMVANKEYVIPHIEKYTVNLT